MHKHYLLILLCFALFACKNQNKNIEQFPLVSADSLSLTPQLFEGKDICVTGKVLHVCPVKGKKIKLLGENKRIIQVLPDTPNGRFERSLNAKYIKVYGKFQETRIPRAHIDSINGTGILLCHIDNTECLDSAWIAAKIKRGTAESSHRKYMDNLYKTMDDTGKEYISVLSLVACKIEEIEIESEALETACNNTPEECNRNCSLCALCLIANIKKQN